jgi:predicted transcriptional regulator
MTNRIENLTAKDVMVNDVLTVYEGWSIKRLTHFFIKHRISGAPVIASDHELVGVVSVSDIMRFDNLSLTDKALLISENVYMESIGQQLMPEDMKTLAEQAEENCTVNSIMTPRVISVEATETLPYVAELMCKHSIRRIFVTKSGVICGIISSGDILAKLAQCKTTNITSP